MPFTGQLGATDSQLGLVVLGGPTPESPGGGGPFVGRFTGQLGTADSVPGWIVLGRAPVTVVSVGPAGWPESNDTAADVEAQPVVMKLT